mmetsp:Transcript_79262/g.214412  ORF Transcript_79262/g.214412 Transcript_79262/m.214412 type:complete len:233 (-) Transcript_79262:731-1429(-)
MTTTTRTRSLRRWCRRRRARKLRSRLPPSWKQRWARRRRWRRWRTSRWTSRRTVSPKWPMSTLSTSRRRRPLSERSGWRTRWRRRASGAAARGMLLRLAPTRAPRTSCWGTSMARSLKTSRPFRSSSGTCLRLSTRPPSRRRRVSPPQRLPRSAGPAGPALTTRETAPGGAVCCAATEGTTAAPAPRCWSGARTAGYAATRRPLVRRWLPRFPQHRPAWRRLGVSDVASAAI